MAKDLRTFVEILRKDNQIIRVKKSVESRNQLSALVWETLPQNAIFFESFAGFADWQAVVGLVD